MKLLTVVLHLEWQRFSSSLNGAEPWLSRGTPVFTLYLAKTVVVKKLAYAATVRCNLSANFAFANFSPLCLYTTETWHTELQ